MQADELYKFSDETLKTIRGELHHRILDFLLGYNKEMSWRKWTAIDKRSPYELKMNQSDSNHLERPETKDDLTGDDLKQYEADIKAMNLILISIPNAIYNSMDSCQTANEIAKKLEKTHDPLALVAHTSSSSRSPSAYYVTHLPSVEALQMCSATIAVEKVIMLGFFQSQEFGILSTLMRSS
nr:integrase, catalytic region, zinc finger, CCHC-type, peptidase aspartic, catalytic [Tanacetum cinerariifolium]